MGAEMVAFLERVLSGLDCPSVASQQIFLSCKIRVPPPSRGVAVVHPRDIERREHCV